MAKMSTIKLTTKQWEYLKEKIYVDVPTSVRIIRDRHRQYFGFTVREHQEFLGWTDSILEIKSEQRITTICLDFYDEAAATMFRLKWL
jgi:hypothetical protein